MQKMVGGYTNMKKYVWWIWASAIFYGCSYVNLLDRDWLVSAIYLIIGIIFWWIGDGRCDKNISSLNSMKKDLEKLEKENKELRDRVTLLEALESHKEAVDHESTF